MENFETDKKNKINWLWPATRRCTAHSKRSGLQCGNWASKGRTTCRFHGSRNSGPKTPEGKERSRLAKLKHGHYSIEDIKSRMLTKLFKAIKKQSVEQLVGANFADRFTKNAAQSIAIRHLNRRFKSLNYEKFRLLRPKMVACYRGDLSVNELAKYLDGEKTP